MERERGGWRDSWGGDGGQREGGPGDPHVGRDVLTSRIVAAVNCGARDATRGFRDREGIWQDGGSVRWGGRKPRKPGGPGWAGADAPPGPRPPAFLSWFRNGLLASGIGVISFMQSDMGREAAYGECVWGLTLAHGGGGTPCPVPPLNAGLSLAPFPLPMDT